MPCRLWTGDAAGLMLQHGCSALAGGGTDTSLLPTALPSGTRLCARSQALSLHVGAAVLGWCPQPRCAIRGLSGSGTDLGPRRGAQPAADEALHLQSKADPPAARPRSNAAQHPRGSCSQPTGSITVWAETRYVGGVFHRGRCTGSFGSRVRRKERALCPGFTAGTFGARLLNSFIFTALPARSLQFHKTSLAAG